MIVENMHTRTFILENRERDVNEVALEGCRCRDVNLPFALEQIAGWQQARKKVPSWAQCEGIVFPPHLNMEQCSSQTTAEYKCRLMRRLMQPILQGDVLVDLTGGLGVDFSFLSSLFKHSFYVEREPLLCNLAQHNFKCLRLSGAQVVCSDGESYLHSIPSIGREAYFKGLCQDETECAGSIRAIYVDPARRDKNGHRVFAIDACSPDVAALRDELFDKADIVMVKLSPMLDWHEALRRLSHGPALGQGCEVHVVAVNNECKELLVVMTHKNGPLRVTCVNDGHEFTYYPMEDDASLNIITWPVEELVGKFLYVPNASLMKAGCFSQLTTIYGLQAVDANSHLFVSAMPVEDFPGRVYQIISISSMNKRDIRHALQGVDRANIAVRNFPIGAETLRKRLKLKEGGSMFLFATTAGKRHLLLFCRPL